MLFILPHTMLAARFLSSSLKDLEAQRHQLMHLEAVDRLVLFLAVCKLYHMSLNLLAETMDIPITTVGSTEAIILLVTLMANHILKVNLLSNNLRCQCTMEVHRPLEATEVSDHSNLSKLAMLFPKIMLDPLLNLCKALFLVSH